MVRFPALNLADLKKTVLCYAPQCYVVKTPKTSDGVDGSVVSFVDSMSYVAEQYKSMRTNLYSLCAGKNIRSIVITSAQPGDGKTVTTANLSFTISMDTEKSVVVIDADMRKPSLHELFGCPQKPGLSDILTNKVNVESLLEKPTIGNLFVIPAGSNVSNSSEILVSTKIKNLLAILKERFNYILFDTPPALHVTDASILGGLCDGALFIARENYTQKNSIEDAYRLLKDAQVNVLAGVLTFNSIPFYYGKSYYSYPYTKDKH
jgi:protein-tyrosine kinase